MDISLSDQNDIIHNLSRSVGKWKILFFYPKDNSPYCTKELCSVRDVYNQFIEKGILLFGCSNDSVASHKIFADALHLPFPLLADTDGRLAKYFDAWGPDPWPPHTIGTLRKTVVIKPDNTLYKTYDVTDVDTHSHELLVELAELIH